MPNRTGNAGGEMMSDEKEKTVCNPNLAHSCNGGGAIYGIGFFGAAIYYISTATSFWTGVLGVLKAGLWPGFLVYELLKYLNM